MIAVDTNILVYAHRRDSQWHDAASTCVRGLAQGKSPWFLPWPCLHEFLAIVTHPRIYSPPSTVKQAVDQVQAWVESPALSLLGEAPGHWETLRKHLIQGRVSGPRVHDARVAAICLDHGVRELWSADRDFSRFQGLLVRNPLVG